MKKLVVSICFGITLSGCISYESLPPSRPITEDEYNKRVKSLAGKTTHNKYKGPTQGAGGGFIPRSAPDDDWDGSWPEERD
jgi:hypothetical protein